MPDFTKERFGVPTHRCERCGEYLNVPKECCGEEPRKLTEGERDEIFTRIVGDIARRQSLDSPRALH